MSDSRHDCNLSIHYLEGFHVDGLRVTALLGALGLVAPGTLEAAVGRLDHEHVGVDDVGGVLAGCSQVVVDRDLRGRVGGWWGEGTRATMSATTLCTTLPEIPGCMTCTYVRSTLAQSVQRKLTSQGG